MDPYYQDEQVTLHHGDAGTVLATLPGESVDCIVTSPPYFGLRDYGVTGQIGAETSPAEFVAAIVAVFREARRVLAEDGTLWLNLGDSYTGGGGGNYGSGKSVKSQGGQQVTNVRNRANAPENGGLPPKNLMGIPWRVAFALQDDGWILRNDVIWAKPNAMPESVTDRLSTRHEHLFMLTKSPRYWFDLDPIRKPHAEESISRASRGRATAYAAPDQAPNKRSESQPNKLGGNPGDVWEIPTKPFAGAHFATFPEELPRRCIASGCKPGGVVLDPCSGSGTTGAAAQALGRRYVGIDINADYLKLSLETRLRDTPLDLGI